MGTSYLGVSRGMSEHMSVLVGGGPCFVST